MSTNSSAPDRAALVVVPAGPGALAPLAEPGRPRDEIDDALDELFGAPDDRGPGPVDAVLLVGGIGAVIAGAVASLPGWVSVVGVGSAALGAVLPVRAALTRLREARHGRRLAALVGDGRLMRRDHPATAAFVNAHTRLLAAAARMADAPRTRVHDVAHSAAVEVASLLAGRLPATEAEVAYVDARREALDALAAVLDDPAVGDGEAIRRRALVEARQEVEELSGGSSVTDAAALARELAPGGD